MPKKAKRGALKPGTSEAEVHVCAVAAYCLLSPNNRTYEAFSSAMHPRQISPRPDCVVDHTLLQYDSKYVHEERVAQDEVISAGHGKCYAVIRVRDRLPPLQNADVNIHVDASKGHKRMRQAMWNHFGEVPDPVVDEWVEKYVLELSGEVEGRGDGREWLRKTMGRYKPKWNHIPFEKEGVLETHRGLFNACGKTVYGSILNTSLYDIVHEPPAVKALEAFFGVAGKQKRGPFLEVTRAYCTDGPRIINWRTPPLLRARVAGRGPATTHRV